MPRLLQHRERDFKKVKEIENYLLKQIREDEDGIEEALIPLMDLMEKSERETIDRETFYREALTLPKVKEFLKDAQRGKTKKGLGSYPRTTIKAFVLLPTTFGIVISKPQGEPLPSLTNETLKSLMASRGDEDSWEKMKFLITYNNTNRRLEKKRKENRECNSKEEQMLKIGKREKD